MIKGGLAQYKKQTEISPAPAADVSFGSRQLTNAWSQFSDEQINKGTHQLINIAAEKGAKAGKKLNFKPGVAFTEVGQAYNKAAVTSHQAFLKTDISQSYAQFTSQAMTNPDASAGQEQFNTLSNEYAKSILTQVPNQDKEMVKTYLNYYHVNGSLKLAPRVAKQEQAINYANHLVSSQNSLNDMQQALQENNASAGKQFLANADKLNKSMVVQGSMSPQQYFKANQENQKQFISTFFQNHYKNLLDTQGGAAAQHFQNQVENQSVNTVEQELEGQSAYDNKKSFVASLLPGFNENDKKGLLNKFSVINKNYLESQNLNKKIVQQNMKDNLIRIKHGGKSSLEVEQDAYLIGMGKLYQEQVHNTKLTTSITDNILSSPVNEQLSLAQQLKPKDPNAKNYVRNLNLYTSVVKNVLNYQSKLHGKALDPYALSQSNNAIQEQNKKFEAQKETGATHSNEINSPLSKPEADPVSNSIAWQLHHGVTPNNVQVGFSSDLDLQANELKNSAPEKQVQVLADAKEKYGSNFHYYLNNMISRGVSPLVQFLDPNPKNPFTQDASKAILTPKQAYIDDHKEAYNEIDGYLSQAFIAHSPKSALAQGWQTVKDAGIDVASGIGRVIGVDKLFSNSQSINNSLNTLNSYLDSKSGFHDPDRATHSSNLRHMYTKLANQFVSEDETIDTAMSRASQYLFHNMQFTPINGQTIGHPPTVSGQVIKAFVDSSENYIKNFPFKISTNAPANLSAAQKKEWTYYHMIKPGKWVNNSNNSGLVYINANGVPVKTSKGEPLQYSFKDIENNINPVVLKDEQDKEAAKNNAMRYATFPFIGEKEALTAIKDEIPRATMLDIAGGSSVGALNEIIKSMTGENPEL